ncbi:hypothetical protein [Nocardia amamiensis]|uniref:hypothetical protein n=1 Tax=Nocardia amamiensis TaxID=404578 RepID=UPI000830305C|nr:hypothetical protein [Nocardia amamiensis]
MKLPGRRVHAGVWFRLLRTLLDELSLSAAAVRKDSARTLAQVWEIAELRPRAGIRIWQPYERLAWPQQEDLLIAAAVALDLAAHRRLRPQGTLAGLLVPPGAEPVYPGDPPAIPRRPQARVRFPAARHLRRPEEFAAVVTELEHAVRNDPDTARQVLAFLTGRDPSPANHARTREMLIRTVGMPPGFVRTRAETEAVLTLYGHHRDEVAAVLTEYAQEAGLRDTAAELYTPDDVTQLRARLDL